MKELEKFLNEYKFDYYLYEKFLQIFTDKEIPSHILITLINILTYNFKEVKFSVPFTYGNPYLLISWKGLK